MRRRQFLLSGAATVTTFSAIRGVAATPGCTLAMEGEEGPYYVDAAKFRENVAESRQGVPLRLQLAVVDAKSCAPLENAAVDIWHCDALGTYSGFTAQGSGGRGFGGRGQIDPTRFLRGVQITGKQGLVEFASIYPGWYQGRTIHVHLKVHLGGGLANETYNGGHVSHTGQLYFPEEVTAEIAGMKPYEANAGVHRTLHSEDGIYKSQHGELSLVALERMKPGSNEGGFVAVASLAVDPDLTPAAVGGRGGGRGRGPRF